MSDPAARADLTKRQLPSMTLAKGIESLPLAAQAHIASTSDDSSTRFEVSGVAVVTGGLGTIALTVVRALLQHGLTGLMLLDLDVSSDSSKTKVEELKEEFPGRKIETESVDVTDEEAVAKVMATAAEKLGGIDYLLCFAGIVNCTHALELSPKVFRKLLDVNTTGSFICAQAAAKHMVKANAGGRIVFIASISAHRVNYPQPQVAYNTSKGALLMLKSSLAAEWAQYGITVNSVSPGYMDTILNEGEGLADARKSWADRNPNGRMGKPEELSGTILLLCSKAGSYINGGDIVVDGGGVGILAIGLLASFVYERIDLIQSFYYNAPSRLTKVNNIGRYEIKFQDQIRSCEDVLLIEEYHLALLACDPGRERHNTVMGVFAGNVSNNAELWAYDYENTSGPDAESLKKINVNGFPHANDFHTLGMAFDLKSSTLFVASHAQAGSRVEHFTFDIASLTATYVQTIQHPLLNGPNSIAIINEHEFYVTNDHYILKKDSFLFSNLETYLGTPTGTVVHVNLKDSEINAKVVARVPFANGIEIINSSTVAVASSSRAGVYLFNTPNATTFKQTSKIRLPFLPDNLSTSGGKLMIAGHGHLPALAKFTHSRRICNDPFEYERADVSAKEACSTLEAVSWVSEWSESEGLKHLYVDTEYPSSSTVVRDAGKGVGIITGLYAKEQPIDGLVHANENSVPFPFPFPFPFLFLFLFLSSVVNGLKPDPISFQPNDHGSQLKCHVLAAPNEVLRIITGNASESLLDEKLPHAPPPYNDLKSMALTCRRFNYFATENLYSCVDLSTDDAFLRLYRTFRDRLELRTHCTQLMLRVGQNLPQEQGLNWDILFDKASTGLPPGLDDSDKAKPFLDIVFWCIVWLKNIQSLAMSGKWFSGKSGLIAYILSVASIPGRKLERIAFTEDSDSESSPVNLNMLPFWLEIITHDIKHLKIAWGHSPREPLLDVSSDCSQPYVL
ncbi:Serum paraoxonase/lactonase 3 [Fusarium austroafricanum]|uniref:Serum paraoxonase/lactonase 3 n=1 Tax=Fusarium austroafricanum TaxID=2364996 RepID=A0A8H4KW37_9HYPO|nr:Serum paraoxonase/lactonase 3 [Fusarium austroafricanum]